MFKQQKLNIFEQEHYKAPFFIDEIADLIRANWGTKYITTDDDSTFYIEYLDQGNEAYISWAYAHDEGIEIAIEVQDHDDLVYGVMSGVIIKKLHTP